MKRSTTKEFEENQQTEVKELTRVLGYDVSTLTTFSCAGVWKMLNSFIRRRIKREYQVVALIWIMGFVFYLGVLTRDPLIYGIDGPYYLIQVRSLLETGHLVYGDPPLSFVFFAFFSVVFGGDLTFGIRVGVAFFGALSAVPLYFWVTKITHSQFSGVVAMLICIFSALHLRLLNDLLKNAVGAFFLLCFAYYLHSLATGSENKKNLFLAASFLILTAATHILVFGVALLLMILYSTVALLIDFNRRTIAKNAGILSLTVLVFGVAAFLVFPSLLTDFFKGASFFQGLFTGTGNDTPIQFFFDPMSTIFIAPILGVGYVLSFHEWRNQRREAFLAVASVTIAGTLLSLPFIPVEWLWRFLLMGFIPVAFILGHSVSRVQTMPSSRVKTAVSILLLLCLFMLVLQAVHVSRTLGPIIQESDYEELESIGELIPSNSVLVGDLRYGYWLQYITRCSISSGPSPDLWQNYDHVLFLIDKFSPKRPLIPPNSTNIFEGNRFALYEQSQP
nr:hypothetical protein [Candidatus Njordarchaeota archaeon]